MERFNRELEAHIAAIYPGEKKILVFGDGAPHSRVMMIGEAPGEQESLQLKPFVGKAGKNLDEFLALTGLVRSELYISNTVKFRPTKLSKAGRLVNRPPTKEEVQIFLPWLKREIALVEPEVVVTLGNVPLKALTGNRSVIGALHGQFLELEGRTLYPIYHPASLIYNRSLADTYRADLERLKCWLDGAR
ncbi:MAG: uracil-DNA glycosylase [Clostridia bacterium]|nr:uracil-DNA glycosylase [Clostridia bacterium]